jgi:septal ring factor EnvC (AmiA/AmiB activator)
MSANKNTAPLDEYIDAYLRGINVDTDTHMFGDGDRNGYAAATLRALNIALMADGGTMGVAEITERAENLRAMLDAAVRERDEARRHLGNLLARIHRDGGQYQERHGTEKAVADADRIVANRNAELDEAREDVETLRKLNDQLLEQLEIERDEARAALAAARREGAEALRERAATIAANYGHLRTAESICDLPLPGDKP